MKKIKHSVKISGTLIALSTAVIISLILLLFTSDSPGKTIYFFIAGPFLNSWYFGNMLNDAVILIFTGLGISIAFKTGVFNLGGEGQVYSGAITATAICLTFPLIPGPAGIFLSLAAGAVIGAIIAGFSGFLKMKWNINELITSFLISAAVIPIINMIITGPLRDQKSYLLTTPKIPASFQLLSILSPSHLNIGLVFAIAAAIVLYIYIYHTFWGYELRICGVNREFAHFGGIGVNTYLILPLIISGALHGFAGALSIIGTQHAAIQGFSAGMGWNGIAVALIARNHPLGVIPAAIVFAYLNTAANTAMLFTDFSFELNSIIQAVIFFLITADIIAKRKKGIQ